MRQRKSNLGLEFCAQSTRLVSVYRKIRMSKARILSSISVVSLVVVATLNAGAQSESSNGTNSKAELHAIRQEISELKNKQLNRPKDIWDKLGTVSTLVSGLLVTAIGLYATQKYAERQRNKEARIKEQEIQIQQVEIVEKFFPYLMSADELKKSAALQAIATVGNEKLALRLAKIFDNNLQSEERSSSLSLSSPAPYDPARIDKLLGQSTVLIKSWYGAMGVGFFCTSWGLIIALDYVVRDMPKALINVTRSDGSTGTAQVWLIDTKKGLALLSSRFEDETKPLLGESIAPVPGIEVFTIGHNSAKETFIPLTGKISKYQILEPNRVCVDLDYLNVMAGSPVVTNKGHFIGIVSEYSAETRQAILIPASVIDGAFLEYRKDVEVWKQRQKEEYMLPRAGGR